jgi:hydroxyacylglutathione hydrolase
MTGFGAAFGAAFVAAIAMPDLIDYDHGICAIDSGYQRPLMDAIHLVVEGGRAAIIDTGTRDSVPRVLAALKAKGLGPGSVDYVMLTHVHLDHAGGAGALMREFPNARLTVHPRGARHMADPSTLIAGTIAVYGEAEMRRMYGDIPPVANERIIETPDGSAVKLAGREFVFHDVPGHARHHVAIQDLKSGHVFSGDTFGMSFRELDEDGRQFIFPSTTPPQFDPEAFHRSTDRIAGLRPDAVYVTHYSRIDDIARKADVLHRQLEALVALALSLRDAGPARHQRLVAGVNDLIVAESQRAGFAHSRDKVLACYAMDGELNAQGLGVWLDTLDKPTKPQSS